MCPLAGWLTVCLAGGCPPKTLNPNPNLEATMCCSLFLKRTLLFWAMGDFLGVFYVVFGELGGDADTHAIAA
jgi:hypothetical protein